MKAAHWVRRTLLVVFCLGLLAAIGAVFTQVIAARVPEQRATLEKLITDRTGLAVRFDNVHFAWDIDGTSAVFERVELTDPARGRVRVVAPELRVEFDTWDFLRHQQFSLGHVTLSSPDIDIIGDPEPGAAPADPTTAPRNARPTRGEDEAALVRRFTAWAELMPVGRVEVEGARVHLYRRGERVARHDFTLSQAVVSRGSHSFNAFGTMLLSQDIGQSLFVSAKLTDVGAKGGVGGELRVIARRVFLERFAPLAARGRGTVDARLTLRDGRLHEGQWQVSARELELPRDLRFDHFTVKGRLSRASEDLLLDFTDLQLTRGARLERAPRLSARLSLAPGSVQVARVTATAERLPFMAGEFLAGVLAPRVAPALQAGPDGWSPTAGELRSLRYDSRADSFSAQVVGGELTRAADQARITHLAARVAIESGATRLAFDDATVAQVHLGTAAPRELKLAGSVATRGHDLAELDFESLRLRSGEGELRADGVWMAGKNSGKPLAVEFTSVDRALLADTWNLLALEGLAQLADLHAGQIVTGQMSLVPLAEDARAVDWQRSRGSLQLAGLEAAGADTPRLASAAGKLEFARGGARLHLTAGTIEDLELSEARIDWPRRGEPRLRASAQGNLQSPLLRRALEEQGLERLVGVVRLEAEARGDHELRTPGSWRVTARLSEASVPLGPDVPAVEALSGTVRVAAGQLRGLALSGRWLGGPVEIESRRAARGALSAAVSGTADAAPLLQLLGQAEAARQVNGQVAWSGTLQRREGPGSGWQATLNGNLASVESRLPEPFDKARARPLTVDANLRFDARGVREFEIVSGRDRVRGRLDEGVITARFEVQGVSGELRDTGSAEPRLTIDRLELRRAPGVLAAAGALLGEDSDLAVDVVELRHANRELGALEASLARRAGGVEFSLESAQGAAHELSATGTCTTADGRCRLEFTLDTRTLPALLASTELPAEWPMQSLRAAGQLSWGIADTDLTRALAGNFELETQGDSSAHQLMASATLADGQIQLTNVQGNGPDPDQVFRGSGRVSLLARTYDLTIDYEQVSLAASAVPTPARARLARAWTSLRGSAARRGWAESSPARRVQWHGSWEPH